MGDFKETPFSRHNRAGMAINPQICEHVQGLHKFKPVKMPAQSRGKGHKIPPLPMKLFETDNCSERENGFASME